MKDLFYSYIGNHRMVKHSGAAAQKAFQGIPLWYKLAQSFCVSRNPVVYMLQPPLFIVDFNITVTNQVAFDLVIKIPCFLGS